MKFAGLPLLQLIDRLASPDQEWHATIQFAQWLQYHLHCQLLRVSQYAQDKGVALKGDLPIGGALERGFLGSLR